MTAVQTVLNDSDIPLWQVPRDAYRQVIASMADLELNLTSSGPLGARPYGELESANQELNALGVPTGETFVLGDSPLVLPERHSRLHSLDSALLLRDLYAKVRRHGKAVRPGTPVRRGAGPRW